MIANAGPEAFGEDGLDLQVVAVTLEAEGVISLRLRDPEGRELPAWKPGSHLELILPSGLSRQYSLCGSPADRTSYRVAVLREPMGRGGSAELHDLPLVGRRLKVRGPRNHFTLRDSPAYLFIAGGIGVTPILSMIASLPPGSNWTMHYVGRSRRTMAFVDELVAIGGDHVDVVPKDERGRLNLPDVLAGLDARTAVYCCGPTALLQAVEAIVETSSAGVELYTERFVPAEPGAGVLEVPADASAFEVELSRSATVVTVPPDRSALSVIREVVPDVPFSCEEGYCGSCETRVLAGIPEHRDEILSDDERAANKTMFICVSRSCSPRLVLDL